MLITSIESYERSAIARWVREQHPTQRKSRFRTIPGYLPPSSPSSPSSTGYDTMLWFRIGGWATLPKTIIRSDAFCACGRAWHMMVYPHGNKTESQGGTLSVYLCSNSPCPSESPVKARFEISVVNHDADNKDGTMSRRTHHSFGETCWGWTLFMPLAELTDKHGFVAHDGSLLLRLRLACDAST